MSQRGSALIITMAGIVSLVGGIIWAIPQEPLSTGLRRIVDQPWGLVTLVDLYLGLAVIGVWIFLVQRGLWRSLPWWIALACLGNLATLVFLMYRLVVSADVRDAFLGGGPDRDGRERNA